MRLLRPMRLLVPAVAVLAALGLVLVVGLIAFTVNGGGARPASAFAACDAGLRSGVGLVGDRPGTTAATLSEEQRANAATIIGVAREIGAPPARGSWRWPPRCRSRRSATSTTATATRSGCSSSARRRAGAHRRR